MKVLLWGGGSKARMVIEMIGDLYPEANIIGIYDNTIKNLPFNSTVKHFSEAADLQMLLGRSSHFSVCIGAENGYARYMISDKLRSSGLSPIPLISEVGFLEKSASCGAGVQIMPGAIAHKFVSIGDFCILNTNATIDHECCIGNGVHVMGGATIAGRVDIGDYSTVGTNATVLPDLRIGKSSFVGAGAVVTKDVPDYTLVMGVPAKPMKKIYPEYLLPSELGGL